MSEIEAMLSTLRQRHDKRADKITASIMPEPETCFDFSTLPEFRQLKMQRAAGEVFGINSPFFQTGHHVDGTKISIGDKIALQFASYDYLGLNQHNDVRKAAADAAMKWGVSATASRLVGGERPYHGALEQGIARKYGVEAALAFVSGHATNVSVISTLVGPKDLVVMDSLSHNSISEGVRLSGATRLVFPHNNLDWLDQKLLEIRGRFEHVLIVVEGLYSMDGDTPDLAKLVEIKSRHDSWLMVDEAHSFGVLGATGGGISEHSGVDPSSVEIWMGTLSKTLGSSGGYIAGSQALIDLLKFKAAGFVFSVGISAPLAVAALSALNLLSRDRIAKLHDNGEYFLKCAKNAGLDIGYSEGAAITPVIFGDSIKAIVASNLLLDRGVYALPIIFPAVPEKQARLRFFITAAHSFKDIDTAITAMVAVKSEVENLPDLAGMLPVN